MPSIDARLLEHATPEEVARYRDLLRVELAERSPLDYASVEFPETRRWPQLEMLNEEIVALTEYRLTPYGPVAPENVQWWYELSKGSKKGVRLPATGVHNLPDDDKLAAYGAYVLQDTTYRGVAIPAGTPIVFRLAVSMMPRGGKSRIINEVLPNWLLLKDPNLQIGVATYSDDFAGDWGEQQRDRALAHNARCAEDSLSPIMPLPKGGARAPRAVFQVEGAEGKIRYTGTGGAVTGKTLNVEIGDDLIKNDEEAQSEAVRAKIHRFLSNTWWTRKTRRMPSPLNPEPFLPIPIEILVATRWHQRDPIGYACFDEETQELLPGWRYINVPALAVGGPDEDPLGREVGEAHPNAAGLTRQQLEERQLSNPGFFAALYQGSPVIEGGNLMSGSFGSFTERPEGWYWTADDGERCFLPREEAIVFASADMAATTKTSADWTVLGVFAYSREHETLLLLDLYRDRITTDRYMEKLLPIIQRYECSVVVVENVTYGQVFAQQLRAKGINVNAEPAVSDKVSRLVTSQQPFRVRSQRLLTPRTAPWLVRLKQEVEVFPNGDHDDQVDMLAFAGLQLRRFPKYVVNNRRKGAPSYEQMIEEQVDREARERARSRRRTGRSVWSQI